MAEEAGGLGERIEAALAERIGEAVEAACVQLLVDLRRARGGAAPSADDPGDRKELQGLARELLLHLRAGFAEARPTAETGRDVAALLAEQTVLARSLPDYWQRLEVLTKAFVQARLSAPARPPGLLRRLLGRG